MRLNSGKRSVSRNAFSPLGKSMMGLVEAKRDGVNTGRFGVEGAVYRLCWNCIILQLLVGERNPMSVRESPTVDGTG